MPQSQRQISPYPKANNPSYSLPTQSRLCLEFCLHLKCHPLQYASGCSMIIQVAELVPFHILASGISLESVCTRPARSHREVPVTALLLLTKGEVWGTLPAYKVSRGALDQNPQLWTPDLTSEKET